MAAIVKYHWDFGDGDYSDEQSPVHVYLEPNTYYALLTATADDGTVVEATFTIYVYDNDYPDQAGTSGSTGATGAGAGGAGAGGAGAGSAWTGGIRVTAATGTEGYVITYTDYCLRHALPQQPAQGIGWSEYDGPGWPLPVGFRGACEVMDKADDSRLFVMDARTLRVHEIAVPDEWRDSVDDYSAVEQEAEILWPEEVPQTRAVARLEHTQSHLYVKPWFKDQRNTGDYDSDGYRPGFEMDMFLRQDALPTDAAVTRKVPRDGQLTVDRHFATKYLQMGARIRVAPWRLTQAELWIREIDTGGGPAEKRMTELNYQDEWSEPLFWFSRGYPLLNRSTGSDVAGAYFGLQTGPDSNGASAVGMLAGQSYPVILPASITGDFTFNVWLRSLTVPVTILRATDIFWRMDLTVTGIRCQDSNNDVQIAIPGNDWSRWHMLTVQRTGEHMAVYFDGALVTMYHMHDPYIVYSGALVLFEDGMWFFDARLVGRAVSAGGVQYLYRDVIENKGNATCPVA